jgi:iron(III) transport system permease protein
VIAYAYTDFLQFAGPLQSWLRERTGWGPREYWFPDVRSLGGAVIMLSLVLYPYVYLLRRSAFSSSPTACSKWRVSAVMAHGGTFLRVALPLARPGIVAGTALALMETLADFGTVAYFGCRRLRPVYFARGFRSAIQ